MLDSEEEYSQRSSRGTNRAGRGGDSGLSMVLQRDRRGMFDHDDEEPLQHLHLDPRVSEELEDAYAAVQDDGWQPWQEEEKKEDASEVRLSERRAELGSEQAARHVGAGRGWAGQGAGVLPSSLAFALVFRPRLACFLLAQGFSRTPLTGPPGVCTLFSCCFLSG